MYGVQQPRVHGQHRQDQGINEAPDPVVAGKRNSGRAQCNGPKAAKVDIDDVGMHHLKLIKEELGIQDDDTVCILDRTIKYFAHYQRDTAPLNSGQVTGHVRHQTVNVNSDPEYPDESAAFTKLSKMLFPDEAVDVCNLLSKAEEIVRWHKAVITNAVWQKTKNRFCVQHKLAGGAVIKRNPQEIQEVKNALSQRMPLPVKELNNHVTQYQLSEYSPILSSIPEGNNTAPRTVSGTPKVKAKTWIPPDSLQPSHETAAVTANSLSHEDCPETSDIQTGESTGNKEMASIETEEAGDSDASSIPRYFITIENPESKRVIPEDLLFREDVPDSLLDKFNIRVKRKKKARPNKKAKTGNGQKNKSSPHPAIQGLHRQAAQLAQKAVPLPKESPQPHCQSSMPQEQSLENMKFMQLNSSSSPRPTGSILDTSDYSDEDSIMVPSEPFLRGNESGYDSQIALTPNPDDTDPVTKPVHTSLAKRLLKKHCRYVAGVHQQTGKQDRGTPDSGIALPVKSAYQKPASYTLGSRASGKPELHVEPLTSATPCNFSVQNTPDTTGNNDQSLLTINTRHPDTHQQYTYENVIDDLDLAIETLRSHAQGTTPAGHSYSATTNPEQHTPSKDNVTSFCASDFSSPVSASGRLYSLACRQHHAEYLAGTQYFNPQSSAPASCQKVQPKIPAGTTCKQYIDQPLSNPFCNEIISSHSNNDHGRYYDQNDQVFSQGYNTLAASQSFLPYTHQHRLRDNQQHFRFAPYDQHSRYSQSRHAVTQQTTPIFPTEDSKGKFDDIVTSDKKVSSGSLMTPANQHAFQSQLSGGTAFPNQQQPPPYHFIHNQYSGIVTIQHPSYKSGIF
ncbi:hypothetical protein [Endozoicomonas sp.]|uniref:hypothetical protein n=1 Tax=Endozoicomonas sp. TaxID=1892382 RepID=UPI003AF889D3